MGDESDDGPNVDPVVRAQIKAKMFPEVAAPAKVGRFRINAELGRGGMGVVYVGFDPDLHRPVAIKLLGTASGDTVMHDRLRTEARAMAQLSHPNVVQVHEVGEHEGRVYIAMEFVEGEPLDVWLQANRPRLWSLLDVFIAAGEGLAAAHAKGLVHRDFKPGNVLVSSERGGGFPARVRVADFGLARSEAPPPSAVAALETTLEARGLPIGGGHTRDGALVGTPVYMSPEQLRGHPVTAKSDQFAFCITLFEALYGVRPFEGATLADLTAHVLTGKLADVDESHVPSWLRAAVERGLRADPEDRWESMDELIDELRTGRMEKGLAELNVTAAAHRDDGKRAMRILCAGLGTGVLGGMFIGFVAPSDSTDAELGSASGDDFLLWVWFFLFFLFVGYGVWTAGFLRRGRIDRFGRPRHSVRFETSVPAVRALELVVRSAGIYGYAVDDQNWKAGELCLKTHGSVLTLGGFIRVRVVDGDPTRVELGMRPVIPFSDWWWKSRVLSVADSIRGLLGDAQRFPPVRSFSEA